MRLLQRDILDRIEGEDSIENISSKLFQLGHENDVYDKFIDIDITPNRGDCLSLNGILRELSCFYNISLDTEISNIPLEKLEMQFDNQSKKYCPHISFLKLEIKNPKNDYESYINRYFDELNNKRNNFFTDISNYITYEIGQPTHCYDFEKVSFPLSLKELPSPSNFSPLIGNDVKLDKGELVFSDQEQVINLAGIMGGLKTACSESTKIALIECAHFLPEKIISKGLKYDLSSDASYRFERGTDPACHNFVLRRFLKIVEDHATILKAELFTQSNEDITDFKISSNLIEVERILGISIKEDDFKRHLSNLGIRFLNNQLVIPTFRHDIRDNNDLAEEIARVIGYNALPKNKFQLNKKKQSDFSIENSLRLKLQEAGFNEVINFPFTSDKVSQSIEVDNPIDSSKRFIRTSLRDSLLENLSYNERRQKDIIKFFEISNVYSKKNINDENKKISFIMSGRQGKNHKQFSKHIDKDFVFTTLKKIISNLKEEQIQEIPRDKINTKRKEKIFFVEIDINKIDKLEILSKDNYEFNKLFSYEKVSEFPSISRDLSFSSINISALEELDKYISSLDHPYLKEFFIFDFFENMEKKIFKVGYRFTFVSNSSTLRDEEVDKIIDQIANFCIASEEIEIPGY